MSERPQTGERWRATRVVEGVVRRDPSGWFGIGDGADGWTFEDDEFTDGTWTFEKVTPPLPTTPGSVVRQAGCFLVLSTAGTWGCPDHSGPWIGGSSDYEVFFDAGAS